MTSRSWLFRRLQASHLAGRFRDLRAWSRQLSVRAEPVPRVSAALVIAPHPDDESIGCGGTVALMVAAGAKVDVVYTTNGARGAADRSTAQAGPSQALAKRRADEARAACSMLGVRDVVFLDAEDSGLHHRLDLVGALRDVVHRNAYDIVFMPWPYDGHVDHRSSFELGRRALRRITPAPAVWLYEVWTPLVPNAAVDISAAADVKRRAIACHASQLDALDYVELGMALSRYRSGLRPGAVAAEAFFVTAGNELGQFRG